MWCCCWRRRWRRCCIFLFILVAIFFFFSYLLLCYFRIESIVYFVHCVRRREFFVRKWSKLFIFVAKKKNTIINMRIHQSIPLTVKKKTRDQSDDTKKININHKSNNYCSCAYTVDLNCIGRIWIVSYDCGCAWQRLPQEPCSTNIKKKQNEI